MMLQQKMRLMQEARLRLLLQTLALENRHIINPRAVE